VTTYAKPGPTRIPGRKRCKVRHSPRTPARCKLARNHEGDHRFGWWPDPVEYPGWRGQVSNLDLPLPKLDDRHSTAYLNALAEAGTGPEDAAP
jgi:hypothetical protein